MLEGCVFTCATAHFIFLGPLRNNTLSFDRFSSFHRLILIDTSLRKWQLDELTFALGERRTNIIFLKCAFIYRRNTLVRQSNRQLISFCTDIMYDIVSDKDKNGIDGAACSLYLNGACIRSVVYANERDKLQIITRHADYGHRVCGRLNFVFNKHTKASLFVFTKRKKQCSTIMLLISKHNSTIVGCRCIF